MSGCAVIVMAKAPLPGFAKTRLVPALGADGAAELAARLLDHAVAQALAAGLGAVDLCCAPGPDHPAWRPLAGRRGLVLSDQGDGDLGLRMQRALDRHLRRGDSALLFGTDAPALDAATLRRAAAALESHDAVFVPAHDGGYALVGLRRAAPSLFEHVPWSTDRVMTITRARLAAAGLRHAELPAVHDIDDAADLVHLPADWS